MPSLRFIVLNNLPLLGAELPVSRRWRYRYTFHCTIVIYFVDILIIINKIFLANTLADLILFGFRREHHTQPIVTPADNDGTF